MNLDEELTDDGLVGECVTGSTVENIGHIEKKWREDIIR